MKNEIGRIVLFILSMAFCQISAIKAEGVVDTLLPVAGPNGEGDWYAMPKSRLIRIAERIDSLTLAAALVTPLDSAFSECKAIVEGKDRHIKKLQEQVKNLDEIATAKDGIIWEKERQVKTYSESYAVLEKKHKKKSKALRRWITVAGGLAFALVTSIVILAIK